MSRHAWRLPALVVGAVALAIVLPATARLQARATLEIITKTGLYNPRGLNFGPDGNLYVAEAGSGGGHVTDPNFVSSDTMTKYYGATGAITKIVLGGAFSQPES